MENLIEKKKRQGDLATDDDAAQLDADAHRASDRVFELQRAAGNRTAGAFLQPKLEVGPADDAYEREADDIASRVVHGDSPTRDHTSGAGDGGYVASPDLTAYVQRGGGLPLAQSVRRKLEPSFGMDFANVRVHTDAEAARVSEDIGARAFTHGNDVYFGKGMYRPGTATGDHLLAHELTHVVQQTGSAQRKMITGFKG